MYGYKVKGKIVIVATGYNTKLQLNRLEQRLKNLFPDLDFDIEYKNCVAFASTQDNLGLIGKDPKNTK